ncbi:hypothetical protein EAI_07193 [Harpegnathos saltator]|uniref:Uncharacterized protein n=1 Tax=Harpegnathos saltator TaxID=610380 RepID=E2B9P3_HARSA|nr:hypothetical protein EAI_07193 [Harpegnathos saltator]
MPRIVYRPDLRSHPLPPCNIRCKVPPLDGNARLGVLVVGGRNYSTSEFTTSGDEKNSAALDRFLDNVLKARNSLTRIDEEARRIDHGSRRPNPPVYAGEHSEGSAGTEEDVLGLGDIGYGSRLRGKRGFDRNYEMMRTPWQKKYGGEGARDVPRRVYLDNDMTFRRDTAGVDFDALDRPRGTAVYGEGAPAEQPLKDWVGKKDLRFSGDWPNSNEDPEVTNGEDAWLRNDAPARANLADSGISETIPMSSSLARLARIARKSDDLADSQDDGEKSSQGGIGARRGQAEVASPTREDKFAALRESPAAIRREKPGNTAASSLESLRETVLELKNSLTMSERNGNIIFPRSGIIAIRTIINLISY